MLNQGHQGGQFVRCRAQPCLEDRNHSLAEQQRVTGHGRPSMSAPSNTTAQDALSRRELTAWANSAIAAVQGATLDSIVEVARRKRAERGGFDMRLWLDRIDPTSQ
jgi:hypothetical protein